MKNKIASITVIISLLMIIISSCSKKEDEIKNDPLPPPAPTFLFKIEFNDNSSQADSLKGIVFLSDAQDSIIAESNWENNSIIEFPLTEEWATVGSRFNVTIVHERSARNIVITTYLDILLGASWKYAPSVSNYDYLGPKDLLFENIPNHDGYCFSMDNVSKTSLQPLPVHFSYQYKDNNPYAILLLKSENETDSYLEINDVFNQSNMDLSQMQLCAQKTLTPSASADPIRYSITGYNNLGSNCNFGQYYLGGQEFAVAEPVRIEYPANVFDFIRTSIAQLKENETWYQVTFDDMPEDISWLNAVFELVRDIPSDFQILLAGDIDFCSSQWRWSDGNNSYSYVIYGPNDKKHFALPKLSALVKEKYPNLSRDEFSLWYSQIIDYKEISSYDELNKRFYETEGCFYNNPSDYKSKFYWNSKDKILLENDNYLPY